MIVANKSAVRPVASRVATTDGHSLDHRQPCALCPDGYHISGVEWDPYAADPEQIDDH